MLLLLLLQLLLPETLAPASRIQHTLSFWDELATAAGGDSGGAAGDDRRPKQFDLFWILFRRSVGDDHPLAQLNINASLKQK